MPLWKKILAGLAALGVVAVLVTEWQQSKQFRADSWTAMECVLGPAPVAKKDVAKIFLDRRDEAEIAGRDLERECALLFEKAGETRPGVLVDLTNVVASTGEVLRSRDLDNIELQLQWLVEHLEYDQS